MHPSSPELDEALAQWRQGRAAEALALLEKVVDQPVFAARAYGLQAVILRSLRRDGEALAKAMQAIKLDSSLAEPWECASHLLLARKKWVEAEQILALAVKALPDHALIRSYYSIALAKTGQIELAYAQAQAALQLQPDLSDARLARIEVLCDAGYYDLALQDSAKLQGAAMRETAGFCQGSTAFLTGDMKRGMKLLTSVINSGWRGKDIPEWDGAPAPNQHIALYGGQGYGDTIQFIRYIDRVRQQAGKISMHLQPGLVRLMQDSFPSIPVVVEGETAEKDDASWRCSYPTLANFSEGAFDPLANKIPYLKVNDELAAIWRKRLAHIPHPRIGLVWTTPWEMNNPFRVMKFEALKPLIDIARPHLISLQLGPEAKLAADAGIFDVSPFISDFADSAALISELDLVITLDSAPAHLAGALGKPVWVFLPFNAEWRWLIGREDSIWYPTMRLFRQTRPQDWSDVLLRICVDIKSFLSGDKSTLNPPPWNGVTLNRHPHAVPLPD